MNQKEKSEFAGQFVEKYLAQGFGSLPKSEIDLLVFHLLLNTQEYQGKTNYELSSLLKISESRVKTLRLNSALKYQKIDSRLILSNIIKRYINSEQFADFDGHKVELSLEDPIEKRELENFLKNRGHHAEYVLNAEVLRISPIRLFELIVENLDNPTKKFNKIIQANIENSEIGRELVEDAKTLSQKFRSLRRKTLSADTIMTLIKASAISLI